MYHLINTHIQQILHELPIIEGNHIAEYDWLVQNIQQVGNPEYQRRYKTYWRLNAARLSKDFCEIYFQHLQDGLNNRHPQLTDLANMLYKIPTHQSGRKSLQFSFCSKLCHMLNRGT